MAKYEIIVIIDGTLEAKTANEVNEKLLKLLDNTKDLKVTDWGNRVLAYPIQKRTMGYYFIYNFETSDSDILREFRRLTNINKNVLRFMMINLDKDYGARAINNPKKVKKSNIQLQRYEAIQAKKRQEFAQAGGETSLNKKKVWIKKENPSPNNKDQTKKEVNKEETKEQTNE